MAEVLFLRKEGLIYPKYHLYIWCLNSKNVLAAHIENQNFIDFTI